MRSSLSILNYSILLHETQSLVELDCELRKQDRIARIAPPDRHGRFFRAESDFGGQPGKKRRSEPRSRRFRASYAEGRFSARGAAFGGTGKGVEWRKKARRHTAAAASHSCCHEWRPPARRGGPDRARPGRLPHLPGRLQPDHPDRHAHRRPGGHRAASTPSPSSGTGSTPAPAPAACTATST